MMSISILLFFLAVILAVGTANDGGVTFSGNTQFSSGGPAYFMTAMHSVIDFFASAFGPSAKPRYVISRDANVHPDAVGANNYFLHSSYPQFLNNVYFNVSQRSSHY